MQLSTLRSGRAVFAFGVALAMLVPAAAGAHDGHRHGAADGTAGTASTASTAINQRRFVASTAKPFAALMGDAMAVMEQDMRAASMNSNDEHDFVAMMIPHHQGAVDMAKALLLTTRDPTLRNLAQGMIADQQIEIAYMTAWLARHRATAATTATKVTPATPATPATLKATP